MKESILRYEVEPENARPFTVRLGAAMARIDSIVVAADLTCTVDDLPVPAQKLRVSFHDNIHSCRPPSPISIFDGANLEPTEEHSKGIIVIDSSAENALNTPILSAFMRHTFSCVGSSFIDVETNGKHHHEGTNIIFKTFLVT